MIKYRVRSQKEWMLDQVEYDEWQSLLQTHFQNSRQIEEYKVQFGNDEDRAKVFITYSKAKNVVKIEDSLDKEQFKLIIKSIHDALIDNQFPAVGNKVAFTKQPVNGFYRYKDLFQITPMPEGNPVPPYPTWADLPFILQYRYIKCNDITISMDRETKAFTKYINLLAFFLKGTINTSKQEYSSWGFDMADQSSKTSLFQHGYSMTVHLPPSDDFAFIENALGNEPDNEFYNYMGTTIGKSLSLPIGLDSYLDAALNLKGEPANQFYASLRSINIADNILYQSKSASYLMLVGAIESLIPNDSTKCELCKQPVYEISKRFRDFILKYSNWDPENDSIIKSIYNTRSKMVHRGLLFELDIDHSNMMTWDVVSNNRERNWPIIRKTAFLVTVNWMLEVYQTQLADKIEGQ